MRRLLKAGGVQEGVPAREAAPQGVVARVGGRPGRLAQAPEQRPGRVQAPRTAAGTPPAPAPGRGCPAPLRACKPPNPENFWFVLGQTLISKQECQGRPRAQETALACPHYSTDLQLGLNSRRVGCRQSMHALALSPRKQSETSVWGSGAPGVCTDRTLQRTGDFLTGQVCGGVQHVAGQHQVVVVAHLRRRLLGEVPHLARAGHTPDLHSAQGPIYQILALRPGWGGRAEACHHHSTSCELMWRLPDEMAHKRTAMEPGCLHVG